MTAQPERSFPSAPIEGETEATVDLVGRDWRADEDWREFKQACRFTALLSDGCQVVDPNLVRGYLSDEHGLTIEPRRYSAFWHRASKGRDAFLIADGWVSNTDSKAGNAGKPLRRYRLRADA